MREQVKITSKIPTICKSACVYQIAINNSLANTRVFAMIMPFCTTHGIISLRSRINIVFSALQENKKGEKHFVLHPPHLFLQTMFVFDCVRPRIDRASNQHSAECQRRSPAASGRAQSVLDSTHWRCGRRYRVHACEAVGAFVVIVVIIVCGIGIGIGTGCQRHRRRLCFAAFRRGRFPFVCGARACVRGVGDGDGRGCQCRCCVQR